jgi:hypothetical protein
MLFRWRAGEILQRLLESRSLTGVFLVVSEHPNNIDPVLYEAIGRMTISWAYLEATLDITLHVIHTELGGRNIESIKPWALNRKLKYLRKSAKLVSRFEPVRKSFLEILDVIEESSVTRHDVIHGMLHTPDSPTMEYTLVRFLRGQDALWARRVKIDLQQVIDEAHLILRIAVRMMGLADALRGLAKAQRNKAAREL